MQNKNILGSNFGYINENHGINDRIEIQPKVHLILTRSWNTTIGMFLVYNNNYAFGISFKLNMF